MKDKRFLFEVTEDGKDSFDMEVKATSRQWAFIVVIAAHPQAHKISLLEE